MLFKVAYRNAAKSIKNYVTYFLTMTMIAGFMFAFNTMIFSDDIRRMSEMAGMMGVILLIATFFIIFIAAWLINYMVSFVLERKSREFATYMLLGINRKKISKIYLCENIFVGAGAFFAGIGIGIFFQQILMLVFYKIMEIDYTIKISFGANSFALTLVSYCGGYVAALLRNQRKFKKMSIYGLINMDKQNEELHEKGEALKQWFLPATILYFIFFFYKFFQMSLSGFSVWIYIVLFILSFYFIFMGVSSFLARYVRKKGDGIYYGANLFIFRQMSSKIKNMCFTMGTVGILFTLSLVGATVAFMLNDFQNSQLEESFPFDISIHKSIPTYDFHNEIEVIEKRAGVSDACIYQIFQMNSHTMNDFYYTNLNFFKDKYKGSSDIIGNKYYKYDTFMKLSDYNHLRKMLGYHAAVLGETEYLLQTKKRIKKEIGIQAENLRIKAGDKELRLKDCIDIPFCQNGHNGADYIIVCPDACFNNMTPYYSQMIVKTKQVPDYNLWTELSEMNRDGVEATGTDIIMYHDNTLIQNVALTEMKFVLTFLIFPIFYMGMVFICVAMTVLSVQQLSDSNKYKFRYTVLRNLGLNERQISSIVLKHLVCFYLCPMLLSIIISFPIAIFISFEFVAYTGGNTLASWYWAGSLIFFLGIYLLYFMVTYLEFKRNIFQK